MIKELENDLKKVIEEKSDLEKPEPDSKFHKHRDYLTYGLSASEFRSVMKNFDSRFRELPLEEKFKLALKLAGKHIGEFGHSSIYILTLCVEDIRPEDFDILDRILGEFRSWSQVDYFCGDVIRPLLYKYREKVIKLLREWNNSENRWKRRASVVTFTRKAGESGEFTDTVLKLCENLIRDEEDIVQKGVGWALKDNLRSKPERIIKYVKDLRRRGVSSTITLYAIRDLEGDKRENILKVKKRKG